METGLGTGAVPEGDSSHTLQSERTSVLRLMLSEGVYRDGAMSVLYLSFLDPLSGEDTQYSLSRLPAAVLHENYWQHGDTTHTLTHHLDAQHPIHGT